MHTLINSAWMKPPNVFKLHRSLSAKFDRQVPPPAVVRQHSAPSVIPALAPITALDKPYHNKPNLGAHTYAAGARNAQIQDLAEKLKQAITPGGLYGIAFGAAIGTGAATAVSFAVSFIGMVAHVVPGLGAGLFLGVFVAGTAIGAIVQYRARQANLHRPEVQALIKQLEQFEEELSALSPSQRNGADLRDLRQIQALRSHLSWTFKQGLRQVGYGILGVQPYAELEAFCAQQYGKLTNVFRRKAAEEPAARAP
jgi:hypothetical protein